MSRVNVRKNGKILYLKYRKKKNTNYKIFWKKFKNFQ